jgi:hypothetical protein
MSDIKVLKCKSNDVKICPESQAVYNMDVNTCVLSLYFQSTEARRLCRRTVFTLPVPSRLERHGSSVLYYVLETLRLHLQCSRNRTWVTHSMTLQGDGVLTNAGPCFLTLPGLQLFPALRGEVDFSAQGPMLFVPDIPAVATDHETGTLQQLSLLNGTHLE